MQGRIAYLLERRLRQQLTAAEAAELLIILQQPEHESMVTEVLSDLALAEPQGAALDPIWLQKNVHEIVSLDKKAQAPVHRVHFLKTGWFRYAAAVILVIIIGGGVYYYSRSHEEVAAELPSATAPADIAPGGSIATLTLSDGRTIALDTAADGSLARQGNTDVVKLQNGQLAYKTASSDKLRAMSETFYNTIHIPRGGQYQVTLPDGSKVWLNAASSIRFPTAFRGRSREVEITGEAYFEIAKNTNMPFYVKTNGMAVEVLGTKFNVNAYPDEPSIRTTLLEGSVRIRKDRTTAMLAPGQQADLTTKGNMNIKKDADVDEAVAWKNGLFKLTSSDVGTIMRQLARWYDVEVEFEGGIPSGHITGEVPRNTSLLKVLKVFETSGIHFRIEGKKIVVTQ
jgi:ferric-dicitrate binding protein FerR (iron transport regulator)